MKINIFNSLGHREMTDDPAPPDFYIGRPSPLGNPYFVELYGRKECIEKYRLLLKKRLEDEKSAQSKEIQRMRRSLKEFGIVNLWCWCAPLQCHGDVIKKILLKTR